MKYVLLHKNILTVKEIKKLSTKENIKRYNKGEISLDLFRQRAIDRGAAARRSPEQKAKRAERQLKKYRNLYLKLILNILDLLKLKIY